MDNLQIEHIKGLCVINLTKNLMNKENLSHEDAYRKILTSELYKILMNSDSGLYLESDKYLIEASEIEFYKGKEKFFSFINQN